MPNLLLIVLLLLSSFLHCLASNAMLAKRIEPALVAPRDSNYGGWALSSQSCPAGSKSCPVPNNALSCCPNAYDCKHDSLDQNFCCKTGKSPSIYCDVLALEWLKLPTGLNCQSTIQNIPVCADPSWGLFWSGTGSNYFCCLSNQVGLYAIEDIAGYFPGFGFCGDAGLSYPLSKLASTVRCTIRFPTIKIDSLT
jgi:hypothetical protein